MLAIISKELKSHFTSLFGYFYYGLFFLATGIFFVSNCLNTYSTQFGYYVLSRSFIVIIMVIPLCTMKAFAQEKRDRTDLLLATSPLSSMSILMGKWISMVAFILIPVVGSMIYPVVIASCGKMSISFTAGTYIAVILISICLISVGMFISSLLSNTIVAVIITYAVYAVILLGRVVETLVSNEYIYGFVHEISLYNKFYDMISGIVRSGDVCYLILITIMFLLLTWFVLESKRVRLKFTILKSVLTIAVGIFLCTISLNYTKVYDLTAEKLLTLKDVTKETVSGVEKETKIYYIGQKSRANATYKELLNLYDKLSEQVSVGYVDVEENASFRQQYLSDLSTINEASILVVCGENTIYLDSADYVSTIQTSQYSSESYLNIENQITSAIHCVNSEESNKIYEVTGHNEETINKTFVNMLLLNNYTVDTLNLSENISSFQSTIPENCEALIINSPGIDYSDEEIKVLAEYLANGGKLFVTIDPLNENNTKLTEFLKQYGFDVQSGVVIEAEEGRYAYDTPYYIIPKMEDTAFTDSLIDNNMQILTMTSKGITKGGSANGYTNIDVLTTSAKSYSKIENFDNITSKSENDISGPFSVASCASNPNAGTLFLLTSNVFFNQDVDTDSNGANRKFLLNIMDYMTGKESGVMIEGKEVGNQVALYRSSTIKPTKIITIIVIPLIIILIGILIVLMRYNIIRFKFMTKKEMKADEE